MIGFFRMNFNYFLKVVKRNIFKLKIKDKGFSRLKVFMFYLNYIDRFMPKKNKRIINAKISMIFAIIKRLVISNLAHNIKNYSGIELNFKRWSEWTSVVDLANQLSYSKKAKNQILKKSIEILILDSFYGRGKEDRDIALENINKIIKLLELPETSKDIEDFILNCALYIFSFKNELPIVPNIDDNLCISQLELLELIIIMLGFPSQSYSFRKKIAFKSLECINCIETLDELSIRRAFFASIETLDFEMSKKIIDIANRLKINPNTLNTITFYYELFTNKTFTKSFELLANEEEKQFMKFIANKSVAIVAPLPVETKSGKEIDSHDYVLRMGIPYHPKDLNPLIYGSRTDIGSLVAEGIQNSKNMIKNRLIIGKNIKYLLFSKLDGTILENFKFEIPIVRKRTLGGRDNLSDKNINSVPQIVIFLLGSGASKISLYSMNFYMSSNVYFKSYSTALPNLHSLFLLDSLVVGHIYLKRLYDLGLIDSDENALEIIKLSTEEYIQNIEDIYRDTIRMSIK